MSEKLEPLIGANGQAVEILTINGGPVEIDAEIAGLVRVLNDGGFGTVASCSGHGHRPANIALADGREIILARCFDEARKIDTLFTDIYGNTRTPSPSSALDDVVETVVVAAEMAMQEYQKGTIKSADVIEHVRCTVSDALKYGTSRTVSESAPNKAVGAETPPVRSAGEVGRLVDLLWAATAHGDEDHRAWLREACTAFFAGQPVPEPRGKGNKEALLQRYAAALEEIAGFVPDRSSNVSTQQLIEAIKFIARTALEGVSEPSPPTVT